MALRIPTEALLTAADEIRLARDIEAGVLASDVLARGDFRAATAPELAALVEAGERSWQRFLLANVRLVQMVATREVARTAMPMDELFQEGFLGLTEALQRWDHRQGLRFSTFALFWVRQRVQDVAARQCGVLLVCGKTALRVRRLRAVEARLTQELGRAPGADDVALASGRPADWVSRMFGLAAPTGLAGVELRAADQEEPHPFLDDLLEALDRLPDPERAILRLRLGFETGQPVKQVEVAERLGCSESTIRRCERRALHRLRSLVDGWREAA